jgi:diguanylate cyclase (GGDEF)-like protein
MVFTRSLRHFLTLVAVPLLLAGAGTIWQTTDLVTRLSTGANGEDHKRTAEVVESALQAGRQQLANVISDNANWDDAAVSMSASTIDEAFVASAWGDPSATGVNYDGVLVTDEQGRRLTSYRSGQAFAVDPQDYFRGRLESVLRAVPQNNRTFGSASSLIDTADGPAIVAVGNLVPTSESIRLEISTPRFLVFWKFLTPAYVSEIGEKFVVKDLRLVDRSHMGPDDFPVTNSLGDTLGALQWLDRRPGDLALTTVLPKAYTMLLVLVVVMSAIGLISWRQFRQIAARERQALRDAKHDVLTGLPNRHALMEELEGLLGRRVPAVAVTFVDLDGFKEVNDTYDHETGDRLIAAVAAGFAVLATGSRLISRIGGDEFVIVHAGTDAEAQARATADHVIAFLESPVDINGKLARVGASIGIATAAGPGLTAGELMRRADVAMYAAKGAGKNCYRMFDIAMDVSRDETAAIARDLRRILDEDRLEVAYQPIIDATTLQVVGVEALARWPADVKPVIAPDRFIPIAETAGLIDRLGNAVLAMACRDALAWPALRVSVNVSPVQMRHPHFAADTLATIDRSGIARGRVELEVTEGTMIDDIQRLQPLFRALHEAGVSLALDDFGSGYSSIAYLRELNFNRIKIDRSLINAMLTSETARNMIQATGLIASGVGATLTAEGVGSPEEMEILRLAGCSAFQGFYFGKPQPASAITTSLAAAPAETAVA